MQNTYALAVVKAFGLSRLPLPLMTLAEAREAQQTLAKYGKAVVVFNTKAE